MRLILISLVLVANHASAKMLRWRDCVQQVIDNNSELKANSASVASIHEQEWVQKGAFLPQLTYEFDYLRQTNGVVDTNTGFVTDVGSTQFMSFLKLNENVFNGFQDYEKWQVAKYNTEAAVDGLKTLKATVSFNLKSAYEGYLYSRAYQKLTLDIIRRREENLKIVELRFQGGGENKGSVLLSRANLNQARFDDLQARNLQDLARTQLRKELGIDELEDLEVEEDIPLGIIHPEKFDIVNLSLEVPDYRQATAQEAASNHAITAALGTFYPQFSVFGEYGTTGLTMYPEDTHWNVGVRVVWSLFNGVRDYASYRGAVENRAQAENNKRHIREQDLVNLRTNHIKLVEAIEKLKVDASFREAATVRAEIARKKYNNGLLSFEDWDIIENDLINRQKNYLQSGRDRVLAEASFEQAQGSGAIP